MFHLCFRIAMSVKSAGVVKLVYTHDSKSCGATHESSSLSSGTMWEEQGLTPCFFACTSANL